MATMTKKKRPNRHDARTKLPIKRTRTASRRDCRGGNNAGLTPCRAWQKPRDESPTVDDTTTGVMFVYG